MKPLAVVVKSTIPNYLSSLPVPDSIGGWFKLSVKEWASLVPFFAAMGGISYVAYRAIKPAVNINKDIRKSEEKVVDIRNIEDLGESTAFCRCWQSKKFPLCDGSHNKFNCQNSENLGPVVIKKKV